MPKNKAFTIIELLVVIAIIGLISSLALLTMDLPTQRQKTKITKTLDFSHSIQNSLGAEALGVWNLDNNASDTSGFGNNGTINGGASFTTDTPQQIIGRGTGKYALSFDGADDYVNVSNFGNIVSGISEITIEAWLKPAVSSGSDDFLWFSATGDKRITVHFPWGTSIIWQFSDFTTCGASLALNQSWVGNWAHYAFLASKSGGYAKIYRNGDQIATGACVTNPLPTSSVFLKIGGRGDTGNGFQGLIDEVRIYSQALTTGQIQKHYAEGLEKHKDLTLK